MTSSAELLHRIAYLQAELGAIARLVALLELEGEAPTPVEAAPAASPPRDVGDVPWRLVGTPPFREGGTNLPIWRAIGGDVVSRNEIAARVERLVAEGAIRSGRPAAVIARDFLGLVVDLGLAEPA